MLSVFLSSLLQIHLGSGAARTRYVFFPDPDPAKSFGSDRIRIHNTADRFQVERKVPGTG